MSNSPIKSPAVCAHAKKHVYRFTAQQLTEQNMDRSEPPTCQQCMDCGALIMNEYEGIGPKKGPNGIPTMLMVESMFADQHVFERSFFDGEAILETIKPEDLAESPIAMVYAAKREELINNLLRLGRKFKQRDRTVHVAATLMDNFFNNKRSQSLEQLRVLSNRCLYVFCTTFFLIASKFDEIDDRLVFIKDVQEYYKSININRCLNGNGPQDLIPTYSDIVECERLVMKFYDWNINFAVMGPLMFAEAFISMGTLAKSCNNDESSVGAKTLHFINTLLESRVSLQNVVQMTESHKVAAYVIYKARKIVLEKGGDLGDVWPVEMALITRTSQAEIESLSKRLVSVQREVSNLLSSEKGRSIIEKATQIKREQESERPVDPSIKAALEAAKAGTFRKKLPVYSRASRSASKEKPTNDQLKNPADQANRDLRKIVADCRMQAQKAGTLAKNLQQLPYSKKPKITALQLPPLEHVNLMGKSNSKNSGEKSAESKPQPAFVTVTTQIPATSRASTNQIFQPGNFFNSARLSTKLDSSRMSQGRQKQQHQPKQRLIAQPSYQKGLAMPESARYVTQIGPTSQKQSARRSVENIVKSAKKRALQKFSPKDSLKSNSALSSIKSTDSIRIHKTKKSSEKLVTSNSKQRNITGMQFLKKRVSQEKYSSVTKIPRIKEAKSSESQLKKKSMRPRVFSMKAEQQMDSIKLRDVCAKLQQQRPVQLAQKENCRSGTESTSVDFRGSRVTSDPASFDRFGEIGTERAAVPKIDLTKCSLKPVPSSKFGLHTQRFSLGANMMSANLPNMISPDVDSEMVRRKNASHDKKSWWSKPTTLTKHLPEAFRMSQQPMLTNNTKMNTQLVSNASRQSLARMHRRGRGFGSQVELPTGLAVNAETNAPTSLYYQLGKKEKSSQPRRLRIERKKSSTHRPLIPSSSCQISERNTVPPTFIQ